MLTVAIICEYNPFHLGHKEQIDAIRAQFTGESVCIIALMSGSFVQRGGIAFLPPADRAEIAVDMGVDLVLELPYPWSMSGADYFAGGALAILEALGSIDYLCFGSESGELDRLKREADRLKSIEYQIALDRSAAQFPTLSWAAVREKAYSSAFGEELTRYAPNDLLAIAYLSHLEKIKPLPILRKSVYSATEARNALGERDFERLSALVPSRCLSFLKKRYEARAQCNTVDLALLSTLRLMSREELASYAEGTVELAGAIAHQLPSCDRIEALVSACTNKKYTSARVRRSLWHAYLRTPADLPSQTPAYTRLFACNKIGREWLSSSRKSAAIPIITRVSNVRDYPNAQAQFFFAEKRNAIRRLLACQTEKNMPLVK